MTLGLAQMTARVHTHTHTQAHTHTHKHTHTHTHTHKHTHTHTSIHTHTSNTHTSTHTCTHKQSHFKQAIKDIFVQAEAEWAHCSRRPIVLASLTSLHVRSNKQLALMLLYFDARVHAGGDWGNPGPDGLIQLPLTLPLTGACLDERGAYLIDNGRLMLLWLGRMVDRQWGMEVCGWILMYA